MSRAEATKARILQAATEEFAAYGIAGARVDRIATAASANKNLIYVYFRNKDGLFDAVFDAHLGRGLDMVPFTPDDLPEYAGRLFDFYQKHPEVLRLATWHRLERGTAAERDPAVAKPTHDDKLASLEAVRKDRADTPDFSPAALLTLVLAIASAWSPTNAASTLGAAGPPSDPAECRNAIVQAVRRLV
ncbi:TetR/AcrR family transcriptional regulator [Streptomyces sp. TRM66268-LWL]|uniref:TetR/AcrR family transcriptional regulator n=1 Tax=Streptomyces polyasparticus TaxID=2767826 RepID=A0ABR7SKI1_9ACTN|nr:TetR family transcriptional regulator [Streptomyces polyasparticus]MBC9714838.1 TetR/AcrR family transcriptional regulator [Streptomyces polyasparticus]